MSEGNSTIYLVSDGKTERLVEATGKAQVRAHLIKPVRIEYATQADLVRALAKGVAVEKANGAED